MRPSSGETETEWGTDMDIKFMAATPGQWISAMAEAQLKCSHLGFPDASADTLKAVAAWMHWQKHGTSYIVDELIGGPWD